MQNKKMKTRRSDGYVVTALRIDSSVSVKSVTDLWRDLLFLSLGGEGGGGGCVGPRVLRRPVSLQREDLLTFEP